MSITPTLGEFQTWVYSVMGIPVSVLPNNSVYFTYAFDVACMIVNQQLNCISYTPPGGSGPITNLYVLAVYNLGGSNILQWAQDIGPPYTTYQNGLPYFQYMRQTFGMNSFVGGVVQSTNDERTNVVLATSEALKNLTIADLQYLNNPYGRAYLSFAQRAGTIWGIS
jgi:hypothetical protein